MGYTCPVEMASGLCLLVSRAWSLLFVFLVLEGLKVTEETDGSSWMVQTHPSREGW